MEKNFIPGDYLPVLIQFIVAFGFVAVTMTLTHFIGGKRKKVRTLRKDENFECGIEVKGNARFPFSVQYFLFWYFDITLLIILWWTSLIHI